MVLGSKEKVLFSNREKLQRSMMKKSNPRPKKLRWQAKLTQGQYLFTESVNAGSDGYRRSYLQISQHKEAHNLGWLGRFPY
jgi:hypothetical protein